MSRPGEPSWGDVVIGPLDDEMKRLRAECDRLRGLIREYAERRAAFVASGYDVTEQDALLVARNALFAEAK